jgi:uncharacterized protein YndB with AHSA1/START domain
MPNVGFTAVSPIIPVRDLDAALDRYRRLGFTVHAYDGPARYGFADRGVVSLHLSEWAEHDPLRTAASVYLYVDDADALYVQWAASGVQGRLVEPVDTDYGLREFAYVDPDGTAHRVGSPLPAKIVSASREIAAPAGRIFELIADPAQQPRWDANDNLAEAPAGQRVHTVGAMFTMALTLGVVRENHVVEFEEGRRIAWRPAEPGQMPPGHLWRWELETLDDAHTRVTHTYDWSQLTDPNRLQRARWTTADKLAGSLTRLAALAEGDN